MAINYNDPRYQQALLSSIARRPYGGIRSNSALTSKWAADQAKQQLLLSAAASRGKLTSAAIEDMAKDYEIAKSKLDIARSRVGLGWGDIDIAQQRLGLGEKRIGLGEKRIGLGEREAALGEQKLGLEGQRLGLANQWADLAFGQDKWKKEFMQNQLDDEERNLWLSTALGIGTTGWTAYETGRRKVLEEQGRNKFNEWWEGLRK